MWSLLAAFAFVAPPVLSEPEKAFYRGDYAKAAALCAETLGREPGDLRARLVLGRAEAAQGRFESAYEAFRAVLRKDPANPDALYYLGVTAGVLAQAEYERLDALAPDSARAHQLRGEALRAQGKNEEADRELQAALDRNPRSLDVLLALGDLARARLAFPEAAGYYTRALAVAPASYDALYGLGVCSAFRGDQPKAAELFRQALAVEKDKAPARLALGTALLLTGDARGAVPELEKATALEPRLRQAHYQLGRAYQALGRAEEAAASFARVQALLAEERTAGDPAAGPDPP